MKRILALVTALLMAVTIVSCDDKKEETDVGYTKGEVVQNAYESNWAGVEYAIPEGLNVLTEEDTYMLMGMTKEDIEKGVDVSELDNVYELYGSSADGSMVIINTFKNIDTVTKIADMKNEFDGKANDILKPSYAEETVVTYGGVEFTRFDVTAAAPDFVMYQTYLLKDVDEHVFCISAAAFTEERVEELLGGISQYK